MIKRLYVHNFRCLENFTLRLGDHRSALLIGKNGRGKSTVRHSLELFQRIARGASQVQECICASDFAQHTTDRPMRFEVELSLSGRKYSYSIAFEWPIGFHQARILEESLTADGNVVFARQHSQITLAGGIEFRLDWHVFALPVINERPGERAIQDIKSYFAAMILIGPIPENIKGFSEAPSMEIEGDAGNLAACLKALFQQKPRAYSHFESFLRNVIPDFSAIENVERGASGTLLVVKFEQKSPPKWIPIEFEHLSGGEKCFFLAAYIVASFEERGEVFVMWDEPDNHLAISEVGHLIVALRKSTGRSGQFIATSHHPETIRKFSDETTFVLTRASHLDPTVARTLSEFGYNGDLVNALIRDEVIG